MWRFVTPAFEKNYKIILFDYVGCGKSDISAYNYKRYSDLNGYVQDVLDICEELALTDVIFLHDIEESLNIFALKPSVIIW